MFLQRLVARSLMGIPVLVALLAAAWLVTGRNAPAVAAPDAGIPFADLIVEDIIPRNQFGGDCTVPAGVDVVVKNIGGAAAGTSVTHLGVGIGPSENVATPGLAAGASVTLHPTVTGIPTGDTYTATANSTGIVIELDESNNARSEFLSVTTLPTCTPSPMPTPVITPPAVGGIARLPDAWDRSVAAGPSAGLLAGIIAGAAISTVALVGVAWRVRRGNHTR